MRPVPLVLSALAALAALSAAFLLYSRFGAPEVAYGSLGYAVESDRQVRVEFEVVKDPARTALCTVRARAADGGQAGLALLRVGPAPQRRVVQTHDLLTTARAVTAEVTDCTLEGL